VGLHILGASTTIPVSAMSIEFSIEDQPRLGTVVARTRAASRDLSDVLGREYGRIMQGLTRQGMHPAGPPFVIYRNMDMDDLDLEVGFPVKGTFTPEGDLVAGEIPACHVVTCLYTGPYTGIGEAYDGLMSWMEEHHFEGTGLAYEFYLNSPAETPASQLMTDIRIPLKA
jgi:effector-binding domain-containing protein